MAPGKKLASTNPRKKPGRISEVGDIREVEEEEKSGKTTNE